MADAVFVFPNITKPQVLETLRIVLDFFQAKSIKVVLPEGLAAEYGTLSFARMIETEPSAIKFAISLGGDGTLLRMVKCVAPYGIPVCGVNMGQLGFLAELELGKLVEQLSSILAGQCSIEKRSMLKACLIRKNREISCVHSLNDIVIARGSSLQMLRLYVDFNSGSRVKYPVDGLIFATTTGSTAYSLSAGGPIVHPSLDAMLITPVCAHALYTRPFVVSMSEQVVVSLALDTEEVVLSADGVTFEKMLKEDKLLIANSEFKVPFVHVDTQDYYATWQIKLRRGEDSANF